MDRAMDPNYPSRYEWERLHQNIGDNEYDEALLETLEQDRRWLQAEVGRLRAENEQLRDGLRTAVWACHCGSWLGGVCTCDDRPSQQDYARLRQTSSAPTEENE